MRIISNLTYTLGALLLGSLTIGQAQAVSFTTSGTFTADNQLVQYSFTIPTAQTIDFFTTSYAGGTNLNGTTSTAGGFVPALTIFNTTTGLVVDCGAAGSTCSTNPMGPTKVDPTTGMADDVNLMENLAAGSYVVDLTEFPNTAIGGINDGFLFSADPTATGDVCGVSGGMFLEADSSPCVQRNGKYSLNVGTVPEPATLWLALPILALGLIFRKRFAFQS